MLACQTARGDYEERFIADVGYDDLMDDIEYDDHHVDAVDRLSTTVGPEYIEFPGGRFFSSHHDYVPSVETAYRQYALLDRLMTSGHWGPFEHAQITLAVEGVTRVTMAQITRHRHVSFDVQSMRYVGVDGSDDSYAVPPSIRDPDHVSGYEGPIDMDCSNHELLEDTYRVRVDELFDWYERMVDNGMPKEDARYILPLATTVNLSMSMNPRALLHIEDMRGQGGGDAQDEIRDLTRMVRAEAREWMPMTMDQYDRHGPHKLAP
jgi:thymidylate synthase (FAD)